MTVKLKNSLGLSALTNEFMRNIVSAIKIRDKIISDGLSHAPLDEQDGVVFIANNLEMPPIVLSGKEIRLELGADRASKLGRGWLFLSNSEPGPRQWSVFCERREGSDNGRLFILSYRLSICEGTKKFVSDCYSAFLEREVDDVGLPLYSELIGSQQLSDIDLISILLQSEEASELRGTLVVVDDEIFGSQRNVKSIRLTTD